MAEYNVQINKYNANNLGYDQLYPQPMKHADTHLLNGSDPINVGELGVSNRNILDNWYFGNPINQRGQTEYTSAGYTIDRWRTFDVDSAVSVTLGENVVNIKSPSSAGHWAQTLEHTIPDNIPVTASILSNGNLYTISGTGNIEFDGIGSFGAKFYYQRNTNRFGFYFVAGASFSVSAAKLELGTVQTLAHQDENGNWVLNDPPPDKGLELLKCQRYCKIYGSISPTLSQPFLVHGFWRKVSDWLQVTMVCPEFRAVPVVSILDGNWLLFDGESTYPIGQIDVYSYIPGVVTLSITSPGNNFSNGKPLALFCNSGRLMLSADL